MTSHSKMLKDIHKEKLKCVILEREILELKKAREELSYFRLLILCSYVWF